MCNASNHRAGCDCGFGPKEGSTGDPIPRSNGRGFQGRIKRGPRRSWGEDAISNESVLRRGLREIGADQHAMRQVIRDYHKEGLPLNKEEFKDLGADSKKKIVNTLKRLVGIRRYKIEEKKTRTIRVPLFTFGAPPISKSKVTYKESIDFKNERVWTVSLVVPGIGMGASQEYETKYSFQYDCPAGVFKTIFAPIRVRVYKLGIYEKGIRVKDGGLRITAEGGKKQRNFQRGIKICRQPDCAKNNAIFETTFFDADDNDESISTKIQERSYQKPIETGIGLNMFGLPISVKVKVALKKTIMLQYELPGGHNYHLYRLKDRHGITWKTSVKKHKKVMQTRPFRQKKQTLHRHPRIHPSSNRIRVHVPH